MGVIFSTEHLAKKVAAKAEKTESNPINPLWEKHRELMRSLTLGVDIAFLHNLAEWERAEAVLEIGCGKGKFLENLLDYFPEKEYVGFDLNKSKEEPEAASGRAGTISIVPTSIFSIPSEHFGRYDVIFIHTLARQIYHPGKFMRQVSKLLRPGGTLVIYEMNDDNIFFRPDPGFAAFFDELPGLKRALSATYFDIQSLVRSATSAGLRLKTNKDVLFPSSYGDNKRQLSKIVSQLLELAEKSDEMDWNFASARRALSRWSTDPSSFGQFAIRRVVVKKSGGWLTKILSVALVIGGGIYLAQNFL